MITVMTKGRGDGSNNDNNSGNGTNALRGDTLNHKPELYNNSRSNEGNEGLFLLIIGRFSGDLKCCNINQALKPF